jgi:CubicO group peptidase (beta-lactamase class C family)
MLFSASKSIFSMLIGAAIDDGLIASVDNPVTSYVPELTDAGFDRVTIRHLLQMDSSMDYVEDDNPLGIHIPFNYTMDLRAAILSLEVRDTPDSEFRYKSGDNALLGLILDRALTGRSITEYFEERLWDRLGAEYGGAWVVDSEGGLERTWCCVAMTARDLARFGRLMLDGGEWEGTRLLSPQWVQRSFEPAFSPDRWPVDYEGSPLVNYGYQWWILDDGSALALGKAGQYLLVNPAHDVVVVRLGEQQGEASWVEIMQRIAAG